MLPGRLGFRFALEALFLVLLAIGAGLADLRPAFIVLVMAVAWLLVAIVEFTAERISASPLTYLLPERAEPPADEAEAVWPMPEERTVVAPPERPEPEPRARAGAGAEKPEPELPVVAAGARAGGRRRACSSAPVPLIPGAAASRTQSPSRLRRRDT